MIIGDMSPGLRGRKPFPLTVHPGDPDPPPPRGIGHSGDKRPSSVGHVFPGGSGYLVTPLGTEGLRHPKALAQPSRGSHMGT